MWFHVKVTVAPGGPVDRCPKVWDVSLRWGTTKMFAFDSTPWSRPHLGTSRDYILLLSELIDKKPLPANSGWLAHILTHHSILRKPHTPTAQSYFHSVCRKQVIVYSHHFDGKGHNLPKSRKNCERTVLVTSFSWITRNITWWGWRGV